MTNFEKIKSLDVDDMTKLLLNLSIFDKFYVDLEDWIEEEVDEDELAWTLDDKSNHWAYEYVNQLEEKKEAISLLKQCVNYDNKPMTTAISGELADKIREFIGRYE